MKNQNENNYDKFKDKWELWRNCLSGEDQHSISNQIGGMLWDMSVFKIVNESRIIAKDNGIALNGTVHGMIDRCFFESQMLAIRRLADSYPIEGNRGVYSLLPLLKDMEGNVELLTREHILKIDNLTHDPEQIRLAMHKFISENIAPGQSVPDWDNATMRHGTIDKLAGVAEANRKPDDKIQKAIISVLKTEIENACNNVNKYVNKYIAHASTPASRSVIDADQIKVTLDIISNAHKTICEVANCLSAILNAESHSFLPVPQFDQFEHIDTPLVSPENVDRIRDAWCEYESETRGWGGCLDEFIRKSAEPHMPCA